MNEISTDAAAAKSPGSATSVASCDFTVFTLLSSEAATEAAEAAAPPAAVSVLISFSFITELMLLAFKSFL